MPNIKIEIDTDTTVLIDKLIDIVCIEGEDGEALSLPAFIEQCRTSEAVSIEGECPDWAMVEALSDDQISLANKERGNATEETINARDFKEALVSLLTGDTMSAEALFSRAIEDDTLRTQVEAILRNYGRKAA